MAEDFIEFKDEEKEEEEEKDVQEEEEEGKEEVVQAVHEEALPTARKITPDDAAVRHAAPFIDADLMYYMALALYRVGRAPRAQAWLNELKRRKGISVVSSASAATAAAFGGAATEFFPARSNDAAAMEQRAAAALFDERVRTLELVMSDSRDMGVKMIAFGVSAMCVVGLAAHYFGSRK